jgi:hypothetical protein
MWIGGGDVIEMREHADIQSVKRLMTFAQLKHPV